MTDIQTEIQERNKKHLEELIENMIYAVKTCDEHEKPFYEGQVKKYALAYHQTTGKYYHRQHEPEGRGELPMRFSKVSLFYPPSPNNQNGN